MINKKIFNKFKHILYMILFLSVFCACSKKPNVSNSRGTGFINNGPKNGGFTNNNNKPNNNKSNNNNNNNKPNDNKPKSDDKVEEIKDKILKSDPEKLDKDELTKIESDFRHLLINPKKEQIKDWAQKDENNDNFLSMISKLPVNNESTYILKNYIEKAKKVGEPVNKEELQEYFDKILNTDDRKKNKDQIGLLIEEGASLAKLNIEQYKKLKEDVFIFANNKIILKAYETINPKLGNDVTDDIFRKFGTLGTEVVEEQKFEIWKSMYERVMDKDQKKEMRNYLFAKGRLETIENIKNSGLWDTRFSDEYEKGGIKGNLIEVLAKSSEEYFLKDVFNNFKESKEDLIVLFDEVPDKQLKLVSEFIYKNKSLPSVKEAFKAIKDPVRKEEIERLLRSEAMKWDGLLELKEEFKDLLVDNMEMRASDIIEEVQWLGSDKQEYRGKKFLELVKDTVKNEEDAKYLLSNKIKDLYTGKEEHFIHDILLVSLTDQIYDALLWIFNLLNEEDAKKAVNLEDKYISEFEEEESEFPIQILLGTRYNVDKRKESKFKETLKFLTEKGADASSLDQFKLGKYLLLLKDEEDMPYKIYENLSNKKKLIELIDSKKYESDYKPIINKIYANLGEEEKEKLRKALEEMGKPRDLLDKN